jgi:hypothetical protein
MINQYINVNFECNTKFIQEKENSFEIEITGKKKNEAKKWVSSKLLDYLQLNFPEDWNDSLNQFCSNVNLNVS